MKRFMVRYKVDGARAADNERYIRKVFEELERAAPSGLRYATFKLDDGVTFVHIVSVETPDGKNPLPALPAFAAEIKERCVELPVLTPLHEVGIYRLFG